MSTALDNERKTAPGEMNYDACGRQRKTAPGEHGCARSKTLFARDQELYRCSEIVVDNPEQP